MEVRPLPREAQRLCDELKAPSRLVRHLRLVHDVAVDLVAALHESFPSLHCNADAVVLGGALHDLGKLLHRNEITGPGDSHERDGPLLLQQHGVDPRLARFARTHGRWNSERVRLEDLLVAAADGLWRGRRNDRLEELIVNEIAEQVAQEHWTVFEKLDRIASRLASNGERRLAWQAAGN